MDYLLLLSSITLGALSSYWFRLGDRVHVKVLNAFTGAYLLSLTFLHLLPELYHEHGQPAHAPLSIGLLILGGFFVQVILDIFSMGIEHGHAHPTHGRLPVGVLAGLCVHAFVEAMPLGNLPAHYDPESRRLLLWSIVLHNYPVSIALIGMLLHGGMRWGAVLKFLGLFAVMAPLGMTLSAQTGLAHHTRELMAVTIGIFMHVSTTILFESSDIHRFNYGKTVAIVLGTGFGVLSVLLH